MDGCDGAVRVPDREGHDAPYRRAVRLLGWSRDKRSLIEGRLTLAGRKSEELTLHEYLDVVYAVYAEQALLVHAAAGVGGDPIAEFEKQLDEPLQVELSGEEMERMRRRRVASENAVSHAKLVGLMNMPRRRELSG